MRGAYPTLRLHGSPACGAFFLADFQRFVGFPSGPVENRAAPPPAATKGLNVGEGGPMPAVGLALIVKIGSSRG